MGWLQRNPTTGNLLRDPTSGKLLRATSMTTPCCCAAEGSDSSSSDCDKPECYWCKQCTTPRKMRIRIKDWGLCNNSGLKPLIQGSLDGEYILCRDIHWAGSGYCKWTCTLEPDEHDHIRYVYNGNEYPFTISINLLGHFWGWKSAIVVVANIGQYGKILYVGVDEDIQENDFRFSSSSSSDSSSSSFTDGDPSSPSSQSLSSASSSSSSESSHSSSSSSQSSDSGPEGTSSSSSPTSASSSSSDSSHSSSSSSSDSSHSSSSSSSSSEGYVLDCRTHEFNFVNGDNLEGHIVTGPLHPYAAGCYGYIGDDEYGMPQYMFTSVCNCVFQEQYQGVKVISGTATAVAVPEEDSDEEMCCGFEWPSSDTSSATSNSSQSDSSSSESSKSSQSRSSASSSSVSSLSDVSDDGDNDGSDDGGSPSDDNSSNTSESVDLPSDSGSDSQSDGDSDDLSTSASDGESDGCAGCGEFFWLQGNREPAAGGTEWVRYSEIGSICTNGSAAIRINGSSDDVTIMMGATDTIGVEWDGDDDDPVTFTLPDICLIFRDTTAFMVSQHVGTNGTVPKTFIQDDATVPPWFPDPVHTYTYPRGDATNHGTGHVQDLAQGGYTNIIDWNGWISVETLRNFGWIDSEGILTFRFAHVPSGGGYAHVSSIECLPEIPAIIDSSSSSSSVDDCYTVTPDILSATVSYFDGGDNFAAGEYRIYYEAGAIEYGPGQGYRVNAGGIGFYVAYDDGASEVQAPGTSTTYGTVAEVEAANAGLIVDIVHTGGTIGIYLGDSPYGDNTGPGVTYRICPIAPNSSSSSSQSSASSGSSNSSSSGDDCPTDCDDCCQRLTMAVTGITGSASGENQTIDFIHWGAVEPENPFLQCYWNTEGFSDFYGLTCSGGVWFATFMSGGGGTFTFTAPNTDGCPPSGGWTFAHTEEDHPGFMDPWEEWAGATLNITPSECP